MMNAQGILERLRIEPHGMARSQPITAGSGSVLRIAADREGELNPAIFIYQIGEGLIAKNDENSDAEGFEWTIAQGGRFTIVVYSNSEHTILYDISLLPPEPNRGPTPAKIPTLATVPVFFATNRQVSSKVPVLLGNHPTEGGELHFGKLNVSIPLDHRMGNFEYPSILRLEFRPDPAKHFVASSVVLTDQASFYKEIKGLVSRSDERDALVFVHGFNTTFEESSLRVAQLAYDLRFKGPALLFAWPSQGELLDYLKDGRNADISARPLRDFLSGLTELGQVRRIYVIAHSMGNRVLVSALTKMGAGRFDVRAIALIAPDIDAALFRELAEQFPRTIGPVALYASSQDKALMASQRLAGYARAGQGGKNMVVIPGIESIDASSVDTSSIGMGHQYYADSRQILGDLYGFFQGQPAERRFALKRSQDGRYWLFVP